MVFNYGECYQVFNEKNQAIPTTKNFLSGQYTKSYQLQIKGKIGMIGIVFRPAAINTIFGLPMYEFSNIRMNLYDVLGKEIDQIQNRIAEAKTYQERIDILDNYLLIKALKSDKKPDRTDYTANLIVQKKGIINISELMDDQYVCRRQFERQFLQKWVSVPNTTLVFVALVICVQSWQINVGKLMIGTI